MLTLQTKKVSNMTKKGKHTVLFICLGNICRSPAAEGIMKSLVEKAGLQDEFEIDSAGIGGWHIGQLPDRCWHRPPQPCPPVPKVRLRPFRNHRGNGQRKLPCHYLHGFFRV